MDRRKESGKLTRECIATALLLLIEEKDYDKISITDITEKAGVSRMAYYRNYNDKDDVLIDFLFEIAQSEEYKDILTKSISFHEVILLICKFLQTNLPLIMAIAKAGQVNRAFDELGKKLYDAFPEISKEIKSEYVTQFYVGAVLSVFKHWVETGMKESAEEITDMICEFMNNDIIQKFESLN